MALSFFWFAGTSSGSFVRLVVCEGGRLLGFRLLCVKLLFSRASSCLHAVFLFYFARVVERGKTPPGVSSLI